MTCGIYCITNKINGKKYVGQSIHIERRFEEHCRKSSGLVIDKAIQKYGKTNFDFEILEKCSNDLDVLNEKEIYWIEKLKTFSDKTQYNCTKGGDNRGHVIGSTQSDNTRNKISSKVCGEKNGRFMISPTISKNGFVNGKQQYVLNYLGKVIARSHSIEKLEYIRDYEDWDNLNVPKVTLIKDGTTQGMQKYTVMYRKVALKTTCDINKAKILLKLAKSKLEGENKEYYQNHLEEVFPCRRYTSKNPSDLNSVSYCNRGYIPSSKNNLNMAKKINKSGVYRVSIEKNRFRYIYKDILGKKRSLCSIDAKNLKQKVMSLNLEWVVLDEEKAKMNGLL